MHFVFIVICIMVKVSATITSLNLTYQLIGLTQDQDHISTTTYYAEFGNANILHAFGLWEDTGPLRGNPPSTWSMQKLKLKHEVGIEPSILEV